MIGLIMLSRQVRGKIEILQGHRIILIERECLFKMAGSIPVVFFAVISDAQPHPQVIVVNFPIQCLLPDHNQAIPLLFNIKPVCLGIDRIKIQRILGFGP